MDLAGDIRELLRGAGGYHRRDGTCGPATPAGFPLCQLLLGYMVQGPGTLAQVPLAACVSSDTLLDLSVPSLPHL